MDFTVSKITLAMMIKLVPPKETLAPNTPLNTKGITPMIVSPHAPIKMM